MNGSRPLAAPVCFLVCALAAGVAAAGQTPPPLPVDKAAVVMAAARAAAGGDARIAAMQTLVATGRTQQVRGDNLIPIEFEIQIELPGKYSRRDEFPAQDNGPAVSGFNGDQLIQQPAPPPPPARPGGPPPPTPEQQAAQVRARANLAKQDFARLMLGLFASSFDAFPLTFAYVAQAEAPQGKADVIDVKGAGNFTARIFIDSQTHRPIMVSWQAPAAPARGGRPGGPPAGGASPVEQRMYFADYRSVDGLQLPFRIRRATGAETTEETTFDRFRINARVDPRRFESGN